MYMYIHVLYLLQYTCVGMDWSQVCCAIISILYCTSVQWMYMRTFIPLPPIYTLMISIKSLYVYSVLYSNLQQTGVVRYMYMCMYCTCILGICIDLPISEFDVCILKV